MAFGEFLGRAVGAASGNEQANQLLQLAGMGYDAFQANQAADMASAERSSAIARQNQLINLQLQQDAQARAEQLALRDRLLQQSSNLSAALQQAYQYLGMPYQVDPQQITRDYMALREQNFGDLTRLVELTSSRAQAANIAKGMGESTLARDDQMRQFEKYAPEFQKADQLAYDAAVARANATRGAVQGSRDAMMKELTNVYGTQFDLEKGLYNGNLNSNLGTTITGQNSVVSSMTDNVRGANQLAADRMANLIEKAPFGDWFNRRSSGGSTITGSAQT